MIRLPPRLPPPGTRGRNPHPAHARRPEVGGRAGTAHAARPHRGSHRERASLWSLLRRNASPSSQSLRASTAIAPVSNALLAAMFVGFVFMTISIPDTFALGCLRESTRELVRFPRGNSGDDATYGKHGRNRIAGTILKVRESACSGPQQEDAHNCEYEFCCAHGGQRLSSAADHHATAHRRARNPLRARCGPRCTTVRCNDLLAVISPAAFACIDLWSTECPTPDGFAPRLCSDAQSEMESRSHFSRFRPPPSPVSVPSAFVRRKMSSR